MTYHSNSLRVVAFNNLKPKTSNHILLVWDSYKKGFKAYLQLEKSLADNSVEAYLRDIDKLTQYLQEASLLKNPADIELKDLQRFIKWIAELGMTPSSQARIISGIKAFYKY